MIESESSTYKNKAEWLDKWDTQLCLEVGFLRNWFDIVKVDKLEKNVLIAKIVNIQWAAHQLTDGRIEHPLSVRVWNYLMTIENEIMALSRIKHDLSCDMLLEKGKPK